MRGTNYNVQRTANNLLIGILYIGVLIFLLSRGQRFIAVLFTFLPFAAMLFTDRRQLLFFAMCISAAQLGVPYIRADTTSLGMVFQFALIGLFIQDLLMRQKTLPRLNQTSFFLLVFILNLLITASIRGFGLYRFGSEMIGGFTYIHLLCALLFIWYLQTITLTPQQVLRLYILMLACCAIPYLTQMLLVRFPQFWLLGEFFVFNTGRIMAAIVAETGGRYETVVGVGYLLICTGLILFYGKKKPAIFISLFGVTLFFMSGFRRYFVLSVFVMILSSLLLSRRKILTCIIWAGIGAVGLALIYSTARNLPHNIQRAVAFLPGIQVEERAYRSGTDSTDWRMELYGYCVEEIPDHLLLGKGMLLSLDDTIYSLSYRAMHWHDPYSHFLTHGYHSGIFELLLDLGVIGLLSFTLFAAVSMGRIWKHLWKYRDENVFLWRMMICLWMVCLALLIDYYLVRGEFRNFITNYLLFYGMLFLAYKSHVKWVEESRLGTEKTGPGQ